METVLEITSLAHGGYGVGRIEGQVCFVAYALPGDKVRIQITRRSKGVLWGQIEEVLEAPSLRLSASRCPYFGACGACTWLHFAYPAQAAWKRRIVRDCLNRIARLDADVGWRENPELRLGYRTRGAFHSDGVKRGFYALGSHQIVDVARCPLCHPRLNAALERLRTVKVSVSVELAVNPEGEEVLTWTQNPEPALRAVFPSAQSASDKEARRSFIFDSVSIVNGAFSQSSLLLNRVLVSLVHEQTGNAARVLDLYCGSGNFSLGLTNATRVLGLDQNRFAVAAAARMGRGEYRTGREDDFTTALQAEPWDVVLLDPPRTGAASIAAALARHPAGTIIYVSCDPATLARDVKTLAGGGWRIANVTAVDMFPHTAHVETVCVLVRE